MLGVDGCCTLLYVIMSTSNMHSPLLWRLNEVALRQVGLSLVQVGGDPLDHFGGGR